MSKVISSFCAADKPQCVEVEATSPDTLTVTDSKPGSLGQALHFTRAEWDAFVEGVKAGEFDYDRLVAAPGSARIGTPAIRAFADA